MAVLAASSLIKLKRSPRDIVLIAASWLRSLLFGASPQDPKTITVACLALTIAAVLAAYLPARRAANLDPLNALRYE